MFVSFSWQRLQMRPHLKMIEGAIIGLEVNARIASLVLETRARNGLNMIEQYISLCRIHNMCHHLFADARIIWL